MHRSFTPIKINIFFFFYRKKRKKKGGKKTTLRCLLAALMRKVFGANGPGLTHKYQL